MKEIKGCFVVYVIDRENQLNNIMISKMKLIKKKKTKILEFV